MGKTLRCLYWMREAGGAHGRGWAWRLKCGLAIELPPRVSLAGPAKQRSQPAALALELWLEGPGLAIGKVASDWLDASRGVAQVPGRAAPLPTPLLCKQEKQTLILRGLLTRRGPPLFPVLWGCSLGLGPGRRYESPWG